MFLLTYWKFATQIIECKSTILHSKLWCEPIGLQFEKQICFHLATIYRDSGSVYNNAKYNRVEGQICIKDRRLLKQKIFKNIFNSTRSLAKIIKVDHKTISGIKLWNYSIIYYKRIILPIYRYEKMIKIMVKILSG